MGTTQASTVKVKRPDPAGDVEVKYIVQASMCQPAVRMVVLQGWICDGWVHCQKYPVVALVMTAVRQLSCPRFHNSSPPLGPAAANVHGWANTGDDVVDLTPAFVNADGYVTTLYDEERGDSYPTVYQVVSCPWPPEQDAEKLKPEIDEVTAAVSRRNSRQ